MVPFYFLNLKLKAFGYFLWLNSLICFDLVRNADSWLSDISLYITVNSYTDTHSPDLKIFHSVVLCGEENLGPIENNQP